MTTTKQTLALWLATSVALVLAACATGADYHVDDDDDDVIDARADSVQVTDGPQAIDARIIDGPVGLPDASMLPDALPGSCTTHAQCGTGMCCFGGLMCIPGDPLPLPPPFDCLPS